VAAYFLAGRADVSQPGDTRTTLAFAGYLVDHASATGLLANVGTTARAWMEGKSRIDHEAHGVTYRNLKVVHYRVFCLELLQNEYSKLSAPHRELVDALLAPYGRLELIDGLESGLIEDHRLPLGPGRTQPSQLQRLKLALTGTPWDMPVEPRQRRDK